MLCGCLIGLFGFYLLLVLVFDCCLLVFGMFASGFDLMLFCLTVCVVCKVDLGFNSCV